METEDDIWKLPEKMCEQLKLIGNETIVMSVNTSKKTTYFTASERGSIFLDKNPDCLQRFKDFIMAVYGSEDVADDQNTFDCVRKNQFREISSDEETEDYSDYENPNAVLKKSGCKEEQRTENSLSDKDKDIQDEKKRKITLLKTRKGIGSSAVTKRAKKKSKIIKKVTGGLNSRRIDKNQQLSIMNSIAKNNGETTLNNLGKALQDAKQGSAIYVPNNKVQCPVCQTSWNGMISYVNHLRSHKDYQLCKICEELVAVDKTSMRTHVKENHSGKNPFKCKICGRAYKTKNGVKNHYVSVHADSSARYWCKICQRAFGTKNNYMSHMRSHKEGIRCFVCVQMFTNINLLSDHMRDFHASFLCLVCSSYFPSQSTLDEHEALHTEEEKEKGIKVDINKFCDSFKEVDNNSDLTMNNVNTDSLKDCSDVDIDTTIRQIYEAPDKISLATTTKKIPQVDTVKTDNGGPARRSFKCKFCGRVFKLAIHFQRHIRLHNNKSNFTCEHCGKVCKNEETFKHHIALHLPDDKKRYRCEECGKGFVTKTNYKKHSLVHSKAKNYICEFCGKACRDTTNLQVHRRCHTGERPYKCKTCTKTYRSWDALKNHQQVHEPKKSFICDICGKVYSQKHRLLEHKRTHSENGLKCDVCGEQLLSVGAVRRHMVIDHLEIAKERGYKIYTCEYCQKILPNKEKYDYHVRIHTGARPFGCSECDKSFRDRKQLKMHRRIHTNDKRYTCTVCNKLFQYNRTLKKHLLSHDTKMPNNGSSHIPVSQLTTSTQCNYPATFSVHNYEATISRTVDPLNMIGQKLSNEIVHPLHQNPQTYPISYFPGRNINETNCHNRQLLHEGHAYGGLYQGQTYGGTH